VAYGGVETAILNWLENLDRSRFDPHLACFTNPGQTEQPFVDAVLKRGMKIEKISWGRRKPVWKSSTELLRLISRFDVDILHTHNCYADCVGALASWRRPVKTITTLYVWSSLGWKRNLIQRVNRVAIQNFDLITAHCDDTYRKTLEMGFSSGKVETLICGFPSQAVDLHWDEREAQRKRLGAHDDEIVLLNVARLYPEKAQASLLQVFRRLLYDVPNARLWIAGVGPLESELRALTSELNLDDKVQFLGFVQDLPTLLALPDIQVNSSTSEGVPLAICSGMAAGLPIVATEVGGLPEVIKNGERGLLVPPENEQAFLDALLFLIRSPEMRKQLGAKARAFIENEYSLSQAVRRVEKTYEEVFAKCGSAS